MTAAIAHVLAMGGYAIYVWPAYGFAFAVLAWMLADSVAAYRRNAHALARLERERNPR
jgi:heme exporter protein CcmD